MAEPTPPPDPEPPAKGRSPSGARDVAAGALAAGATIKDAAAAAGVNERTVRKWLDLSEYRAAVQAMRDEAIRSALDRLGSTMSAAADALKALVGHADARVKLAAARAVLELGVRLKEHLELEQRVKELEQRLGGQTA